MAYSFRNVPLPWPRAHQTHKPPSPRPGFQAPAGGGHTHPPPRGGGGSKSFESFQLIQMIEAFECVFSPGKKDVTERGKKTGARFWGIHFVFPAQAGLSQARPWPPGGTHFFSPPRAGPGMPVGLPLFLTKYLIFYWFYKVC